MYKGIAVLDLHLHTKYSIACSKNADLHGYALLGRRKGIDYLGTGDMFKEEHLNDMKKHLSPVKFGVYQYNEQKFFLTGEISLIYRDNGIVKKVHLLLILSSIDRIIQLKKKLSAFGKIESDGRPILKLSVSHAVKLIKDIDNDSIIIPAHIWTPHFGILGRKSGYDSLHDAVDDVAFFSAVETGLSSDPAMNRMVKELNSINLVSFSDAHSPDKIGREFTMIKAGDIDINILKHALEGSNDMLAGTGEFYPQEGKYYASGHRKCHYVSTRGNSICPVCGKPLTQGVLSRVQALAKNGEGTMHDKDVVYMIPVDLIARYVKKKKMEKSIKAAAEILNSAMPFTHLMAFADRKEIDRVIPYGIGYLIEEIRKGTIRFHPGYDGIYGEPIFEEEE